MPGDPEQKGKVFYGWSSSPNFDVADFKPNKDGNIKATKLTDVSQWDETTTITEEGTQKEVKKAYLVTADSPIDTNRKVYAVWGNEVDGITFKLHTNYGNATEQVKEFQVKEEQTLPRKEDIDGVKNSYNVADRTYDRQVQLAIEAAGNTRNAMLPNAYTYDDASSEGGTNRTSIFAPKVDGTKKFTMVGWSTKPDNNGEIIEKLFANQAIISKDSEGSYYLTTVGYGEGETVGNATTMGPSVKLTPNEDGEIHLYAAWKPYYRIKLTKEWYDENKTGSVNDALNNIAHDPDNHPRLTETKKLQGSIPIYVGLLRRTAVSEWSKPTVTDRANYYVVKDSIKKINASSSTEGDTLEWFYPGYNAYGKRYSYISVEFEQTEEGKQRFYNFDKTWASIWTDVKDSSSDVNRSNQNISKIQNLEYDSGNGIDAYSGATMRLLKGSDSVGAANATVNTGEESWYDFRLMNVKVSLTQPVIRPIYEGTWTFDLEKPNVGSKYDPKYKDQNGINNELILKLNVPGHKIAYFKYDNDDETFKRVSLPTGGEDASTDWQPNTADIDFSVEKIPGENAFRFTSLSPKGEKNNKRYSFFADDKVEAQYMVEGGSPKSQVASFNVRPNEDSPKVNTLVQSEAEYDRDSKTVVLKSAKPVSDLARFSADGKVYLIKSAQGEPVFLLDKDGNKIQADDSENPDVFKFSIPEGSHFEGSTETLKDGDVLDVWNTDGDKRPVASGLATKLDLKGPEITAEDYTVIKGVSNTYRKEGAVTTNEQAKFEKWVVENGDGDIYTNSFSREFVLNKDYSSDANYGQSWTFKYLNNNGYNTGKYKVTLTYRDTLNNRTEKVWNIEVKDQEESVAIKGKQGTYNDGYRIQITDGAKPNATIRVYSKTGALIDEEKLPETLSEPVYITIPSSEKDSIGDMVKITQEEENKKETSPADVDMDVKGPNPVTLKTPIAGTSEITIKDIPTDASYIEAKAMGYDIRLEKNPVTGSWTVKDGYGLKANDDGSITVDLSITQKIFKAGDQVTALARDEFRNSSNLARVSVAEKKTTTPYDIYARDEKDGDVITTKVKGKADPNALITIYKQKEENGKPVMVDNPDWDAEEAGIEGEDYKVQKQIPAYEQIAFGQADKDGNFDLPTVPTQPVGAKIYVEAELDNVKSEKAESTVVQDYNGNGTPDEDEDFDFNQVEKIEVTKDPTKMSYPLQGGDNDNVLNLAGMEVRITSENGKSILVNYDDKGIPSINGPASDQHDSTVDITKLLTANPANGTRLTIEDNDKKPVSLTYTKDQTTKSADTQNLLRVFNDKNKNNIPDEEENFDRNNISAIKVLGWPQLKYKDQEGFNPQGLNLQLFDGIHKDGVVVQYGSDGAEFKDHGLSISPKAEQALSAEDLDLTSNKGDNKRPLVLTVKTADSEKSYVLGSDDASPITDANKEALYKGVSDEKKLYVYYDEDKNGKDDKQETTLLEDLKAFNNSKDSTLTHLKGVSEKGAKIVVKDSQGNEIGTANYVISDDGSFDFGINPRQDVGANLTVEATYGHKKTNTEETIVFADMNNNEYDDALEQDLKVTEFKARNLAGDAYTEVKGQVSQPGSTVIIKDENGQKIAEGPSSSETGIFDFFIGKRVETGSKLLAQAQNGKALSPEVETTVFDDVKNVDWIDDNLIPDAPKFDKAPKAGDSKVYINADSVDLDASKLIIKVGENPEKVFVHDGRTFKTQGENPETVRLDESYEIPVASLNENDEVKVWVVKAEKDNPESEHKSDPAMAIVGKADDLTPPVVPVLDPITEGDPVVVVDLPNDDGDANKVTVKVTDKDGKENTVEAEKTPTGWKVDNKPITVKDGKLDIPVEGLVAGDKVTANATDAAGNTSEDSKPQTVGEAPVKEQLKAPKVDSVKTGDIKITGSGEDGTNIVLKNGEGRVIATVPVVDGKWSAPIYPLKPTDNYTVTAVDPEKQKTDSEPVEVKVGANKAGLEESIKKADPIVTSEEKKDFDQEGSSTDKDLKDAYDKAKTVDENPNATQDDVDKAKKDLDNALKNKDKYDKAKDAVYKAEDNPTKENIQAARDAVDNMPGSTDPTADDYNKDKKDLEDRIGKIDPNTGEITVAPTPKDGDKEVKGTAPANSTVTVKLPGGITSGPVTADSDGNFVVPVPELKGGTSITVEAKDGNKAPKTKNVDVLANPDGLKDAITEGEKLKPNEPPTTEDKKLQDAIAAGKDKFVDGDPTKGLKDGATQAEVDQAEKDIRDAIKAKQDADAKVSEKPVVNEPVKNGQKEVTGTAEPGSVVELYIEGKPTGKIAKADEASGAFTIQVPEDLLEAGKEIKVYAQVLGKNKVESDPVTVALNTDKLVETKSIADDYVASLEKNKDWDPTSENEDGSPTKPFDKNLDDKIKQAEDVLKRVGTDNEPSQADVDKAQKELEDALNKKDADNALAVLEDKLKNEEEISPEEIQEAEEAINKIEGSTDPNATDYDEEKKTLQERLDAIKESLEEQTVLEVNSQRLRDGEDRILAKSNVGNVKVQLFLKGEKIAEFETNSVGTKNVVLDTVLRAGDRIKWVANKDGYQEQSDIFYVGR